MWAYMIVEPTNRNPRRRRSADRASESGRGDRHVPVGRGRRQSSWWWRDDRGQVRLERPELGRDIQEQACIHDRDVDLGAIPHDPGVGHQAVPVTIVERCDHGRVEATEGEPEGLALVQDRGPRQSCLEGLQTQPLEVLLGARDRPSPLLVVIPDHVGVRLRRPGAGPGAAWWIGRHDHGRQGMGASAKSVLRSMGSAPGLAALNTDRKTSPDTFFVPADPIRVTLR